MSLLSTKGLSFITLDGGLRNLAVIAEAEQAYPLRLHAIIVRVFACSFWSLEFGCVHVRFTTVYEANPEKIWDDSLSLLCFRYIDPYLKFDINYF